MIYALLENKITTMHPSGTSGLLSLAVLSLSTTLLEVRTKGTGYKSCVSAQDPKTPEALYWLIRASQIRTGAGMISQLTKMLTLTI